MIELPTWAVPNGASPFVIDFGGFLTPMLGGEVQRINRLGTRFGISVTYPPVMGKDKGRILVSRLIRGKTEGVRIDYPLLDFVPGAVGDVLVDGASQAGSTLAVKAATPNYAFREGQPFSIEEDDRHYLHFVTAETFADSAGEAEIPITPMLRIEPSDNAPCHFKKPQIEGFILGDEWRWQMMIERMVALEFEIRERA